MAGILEMLILPCVLYKIYIYIYSQCNLKKWNDYFFLHGCTHVFSFIIKDTKVNITSSELTWSAGFRVRGSLAEPDIGVAFLMRGALHFGDQ